MRDTVGGIHNLQHLLSSVKVGPKALARVIPFVHASCEPLITSAGDLPRDAGARLGSAESFEDLSGLVTRRMRERQVKSAGFGGASLPWNRFHERMVSVVFRSCPMAFCPGRRSGGIGS